jgi:hypothetical protein
MNYTALYKSASPYQMVVSWPDRKHTAYKQRVATDGDTLIYFVDAFGEVFVSLSPVDFIKRVAQWTLTISETIVNVYLRGQGHQFAYPITSYMTHWTYIAKFNVQADLDSLYYRDLTGTINQIDRAGEIIARYNIPETSLIMPKSIYTVDYGADWYDMVRSRKAKQPVLFRRNRDPKARMRIWNLSKDEEFVLGIDVVVSLGYLRYQYSNAGFVLHSSSTFKPVEGIQIDEQVFTTEDLLELVLLILKPKRICRKTMRKHSIDLAELTQQFIKRRLSGIHSQDC